MPTASAPPTMMSKPPAITSRLGCGEGYARSYGVEAGEELEGEITFTESLSAVSS